MGIIVLTIILLVVGAWSMSSAQSARERRRNKKWKQYQKEQREEENEKHRKEIKQAKETWDNYVNRIGIDLNDARIKIMNRYFTNINSTYPQYWWRDEDEICVFSTRPTKNDKRKMSQMKYEENIRIVKVDVSEFSRYARDGEYCILYDKDNQTFAVFEADDYYKLREILPELEQK